MDRGDRNANFSAYVDPLRRIGSQSEVPKIDENGNSIVVRGYQSFVIRQRRVDRTTIADKYLKIVRYLEQNYAEVAEGSSILDIGCSSGLLCLLASEVGFKRVSGLDHDPEYIAVLEALSRQLGVNIDAILGNWRSTKSKHDIVCMLSLIHWIYSKTAAEGAFSKIFTYLHGITNKFLLIEWIDPEDPAMKDLKHTSANRDIQEEPYEIGGFLAAAEQYFGSLDAKISTSPTRCIYVFRKEARLPGYSSVVRFNKTCVIKAYRSQIIKNSGNLIEREKKALVLLSGQPGFPVILHATESEIFMTSCGDPISLHNIPEDAEEQGRTLIKIMYERKIRHNDIHPANLFVKEGRLHLIDFGWASFGDNEPDFLPRNMGVEQGVRRIDEAFDDRVMLERAIQIVREQGNSRLGPAPMRLPIDRESRVSLVGDPIGFFPDGWVRAHAVLRCRAAAEVASISLKLWAPKRGEPLSLILRAAGQPGVSAMVPKGIVSVLRFELRAAPESEFAVELIADHEQQLSETDGRRGSYVLRGISFS